MKHLFSLVAVVMALGCGTNGDRAIDELTSFVSEADPKLREAYEFQQELCVVAFEPPKEGECVSVVREMWKPIIEGLQRVRELWCAIDSSQCSDAPVEVEVPAPPPVDVKPQPVTPEPQS